MPPMWMLWLPVVSWKVVKSSLAVLLSGLALLGVSLSVQGNVRLTSSDVPPKRRTPSWPGKYWSSAWMGLLLWVMRPSRKGVLVGMLVAFVGEKPTALCVEMLSELGQLWPW